MEQEKKYWEEVAEMAASIPDEYVLVVSRQTRNGGKAGTIAEVDRFTAGKLIVDATHTLASEEQATAYRDTQRQRIEESKREAAARRLQVEVIERNLAGLSTMTAPPAVPEPKSKK